MPHSMWPAGGGAVGFRWSRHYCRPVAPNTFTNWGGNQRCEPTRIETPRSTAEVAIIVGGAHRRGERVKVVGTGHSFTAAACTDGVLLRLSAISGLESIDPHTGVATVGAGTSLRDLSVALDERGRALPNLGDIDVQTVAGATATATHGTGASLGNLATGIVGLELVTGTGETLWCDAVENADIWRSARVGIGALGIITRLALETVPAFALEARETVEPIDDIQADWQTFTESARHAEAIWLPGSAKALVKRNEPSTAPLQPLSRPRHFVDKILLENVALGALMQLTRFVPATTAPVGTLIGSLAQTSTRVDKSFRIFASPRHVRFVEMEYAIPVEAMPEALERVRKHVDALERPTAFPVELRVSAADEIPLSTAFGRATGWIAVHQTKAVPFDEYFRGVERIMNDYDGRPHWGKMHFQTAATLRDRYPAWDEFQRVRASTDPDGTFRNAYLDRVLGPIPT